MLPSREVNGYVGDVLEARIGGRSLGADEGIDARKEAGNMTAGRPVFQRAASLADVGAGEAAPLLTAGRRRHDLERAAPPIAANPREIQCAESRPQRRRLTQHLVDDVLLTIPRRASIRPIEDREPVTHRRAVRERCGLDRVWVFAV